MTLFADQEKIVSCRYGQIAIPGEDDLIATSLRHYGEWAQVELDTLANFISVGNVVIDAGAFIGTHARAFSAMVGKAGVVHAFEPNDSIYEILHKNVAKSPIANIVTYPLALGSVAERRLLVSGPEGDNQGACRLAPRDGDNGEETANVTTLDAVGIEIVDFIKADVEGMELTLLVGADKTINESKPVIFLEVNSLEASYGVLDWARQRKYLAYASVSPAFNPQNFNGVPVNILGEAKECGLLLIHQDKINEHLVSIERLGIPEVKTADDLVLLLLHKPQYAYEVLAKTAVSEKWGVVYPAPSLEEAVADLERRLSATENAKSVAEHLAFDRLAKVETLERRLSATEDAKSVAEHFAFDRQAQLEKLERRLLATKDAKSVAECLALDRQAQLRTIYSSKLWRLARKLGLTSAEGEPNG
jgi:FkbM family methyltransferase